jgi:DNA-directed RNA polymerase II subunit RPB4
MSALLDSHAEFTSVEKAMLGMIGFCHFNISSLIDTLGSLACDSADEAKTLIPSLANKMSDDALQGILDEMSKLREYHRFAEDD